LEIWKFGNLIVLALALWAPQQQTPARGAVSDMNGQPGYRVLVFPDQATRVTLTEGERPQLNRTIKTIPPR
jgi:hypothetical protein